MVGAVQSGERQCVERDAPPHRATRGDPDTYHAPDAQLTGFGRLGIGITHRVRE
jgi:hypothetical protein